MKLRVLLTPPLDSRSRARSRCLIRRFGTSVNRDARSKATFRTPRSSHHADACTGHEETFHGF